MFICSFFVTFLLVNHVAAEDVINTTAKIANIKTEAAAVETTEKPSPTEMKSGRNIRTLVDGKGYVWSPSGISSSRSFAYNDHSRKNPSKGLQLTQLPQQTIYYHGPVGKGKTQSQRFREFAMKNSHIVKSTGGGYGGQTLLPQKSHGYQNQLSSSIRQMQTYEQTGSEPQTGYPSNQLGGNQIQTGYPQPGSVLTGYPSQVQTTQMGGHPQRPGNSQLYNENHFTKPESGDSETGLSLQNRNESQSKYPENGQTMTGYPSNEQYQTGYPGTNQSQTEYPQIPGTSYPQQQGSSQPGYPQRPGTGQSQTGYPQQPNGNQIQGGYPKPDTTQQQVGSQVQGGYPQRPGIGQTQTGYPQQQGSSQTGYPQRPGTGQSQTGYPQQPNGNQIQGGYPKPDTTQQQVGSQVQGGYPQKPVNGQTQTGYPQRPGTGQSQTGYPQQPDGSQIQGGYPNPDTTQQQVGSQVQGGYPQRPGSGQTQTGYPQQQGSSQTGYPQRPGTGQSQTGYPNQIGDGQMQGSYPQKPEVGEYPSNGVFEGSNGLMESGNENEDYGNEIASGESTSGGSNGIGATGITSNEKLRQYCKAPRGQFASESCNKFVNCWDDVVVEQECGGGLVFNEEKSYCDYPENVDCGGRVTSKPETSMEGDGNCPSPFATYRTDYDCGEFIICAHGIAHRFHCPSELAYNDSIGVCDYSQNVDCMGIPLLPYPEEGSESETAEEMLENTNETDDYSNNEMSEPSEASIPVWNYRQGKKSNTSTNK